MRSTKLIALILFLAGTAVSAQRIPVGYLLQYQQGFDNGSALADFKFENPGAWGIFNVNSNFYLQCNATAGHSGLPANIAILNNRVFGDFILEADVMPGKDTSGLSEVCLFLGIRDLTRYYYVQLSNRSDSLSHGIYLVKNSVRLRLSGDSLPPVRWKNDSWHKIRLERDIVKRTIVVYVDNMTQPVLRIKDYELIMGSVGLGTFSTSGRFDNIKIWAPTVISE